MARRDIIPVTVLVFLVTAFVFHVTAIATPDWWYSGSPTFFLRNGIFQTCVGDTCVKIKEQHLTKLAQASGILGAIALLAATSIAFLSLVKEVAGDTTPRIVKIVNCFISLLAVGLLMTCIITFVPQVVNTPKMGISIEICISATCSTFLAVILLVLDIVLSYCC